MAFGLFGFLVVKMINKPRYSVVPHDLLQFDSDFEFLEFIRKEDG